MEQSVHGSPSPSAPPRAVPRGAQLALVRTGLTLALPAEPAPADWAEGLDRLVAWLGIEAAICQPAPASALAGMARWPGMKSAKAAPHPLFAPWNAWSPLAFQHGGLPALPRAQFAASYLFDHPRGMGAAQRGVDLMLVSPHPLHCNAEEAGAPPLPSASLLKAMLRAAQAEGRGRIAIILQARQRNPVAARLLAAQRDLARDDIKLDILTIEEALRPLSQGAAQWDAIIAMPDIRSIVFTLLGEASGVRGPWPMVWHAPGPVLIGTEAAGEGAVRPALDAPALIHALALALKHARAISAAWRLHESWSQLRDSGVTTPGRGVAGPYDSIIPDSEFLARLVAETAVGRRPAPGWRALGGAKREKAGSLFPALRVVSSNLAESLT